MKRNQSREDYLETIFLLGRDGAPVHSVDVARAMNFSPVSVGNAIARLAKDSAIRIDPLKHIYLTEMGYACAVKTYEKHVYFMNLLVSLGMKPEKADVEACSIEHGVSDETFEFIKEALNTRACGRMGFCPGLRIKKQDHDVKKRGKKAGGAADDAEEGPLSYAFPGASSGLADIF
jgi:Mn-dependent DtxR family transcriptional regulator